MLSFEGNIKPASAALRVAASIALFILSVASYSEVAVAAISTARCKWALTTPAVDYRDLPGIKELEESFLSSSEIVLSFDKRRELEYFLYSRLFALHHHLPALKHNLAKLSELVANLRGVQQYEFVTAADGTKSYIVSVKDRRGRELLVRFPYSQTEGALSGKLLQLRIEYRLNDLENRLEAYTRLLKYIESFQESSHRLLLRIGEMQELKGEEAVQRAAAINADAERLDAELIHPFREQFYREMGRFHSYERGDAIAYRIDYQSRAVRSVIVQAQSVKKTLADLLDSSVKQNLHGNVVINALVNVQMRFRTLADESQLYLRKTEDAGQLYEAEFWRTAHAYTEYFARWTELAVNHVQVAESYGSVLGTRIVVRGLRAILDNELGPGYSTAVVWPLTPESLTLRLQQIYLRTVGEVDRVRKDKNPSAEVLAQSDPRAWRIANTLEPFRYYAARLAAVSAFEGVPTVIPYYNEWYPAELFVRVNASESTTHRVRSFRAGDAIEINGQAVEVTELKLTGEKLPMVRVSWVAFNNRTRTWELATRWLALEELQDLSWSEETDGKFRATVDTMMFRRGTN